MTRVFQNGSRSFLHVLVFILVRRPDWAPNQPSGAGTGRRTFELKQFAVAEVGGGNYLFTALPDSVSDSGADFWGDVEGGAVVAVCCESLFCGNIPHFAQPLPVVTGLFRIHRPIQIFVYGVLTVFNV